MGVQEDGHWRWIWFGEGGDLSGREPKLGSQKCFRGVITLRKEETNMWQWTENSNGVY